VKPYSFLTTFITAALLCSQAMAARKIISGIAPEAGHPGEYNTVALVKADGKVFCTGSLIGSNLIATAKHCLVDKELGDFKVYFGDNTEDQTEELYRKVTNFKVRYPTDWSMMFPSFDVAWVEFSGVLPKGFKALPILSDPDFLIENQQIHQVGFGNHSPKRGTIKAGQKLRGTTRLQSFINNPRFFNILVFKGDEGQGSCHGDSGGPAYALVEGDWHIIGVTNGFDIVLTPESMLRTGDPDFPYDVKCSKNHSLYSFLGAHGDWIEQTSGRSIQKNDQFMIQDRTETKLYESLAQWCKATDIGSPNWNLLKVLLDKHVDRIDQSEAADFYNSCEAVTKYLSEIESIRLDFATTMEAKLSFESLTLLPKLKSLHLSNFPAGVLDLKSIKNLELEELTLRNLEIKNLTDFSSNKVRTLSLEKNPLNGLNGIRKFNGLASLNISNTMIKTLKPLEGIQLKELQASGMNAAFLLEMESLNSSLEVLDLRNTVIPAFESALKRFVGLKQLWLTGNTQKLDLMNNINLEYLSLSGFKLGQITFPKTLKKLEQISTNNCDLESISFLNSATNLKKASLTFNRINDLSVFEDFPFPVLTDLNVSVNPILNLSPLRNLNSLKVMRVSRTPIQRNLVPRNEQNCPTQNAPDVLTRFCSK
jgi:hypothetical protein